MNETAQKIMAIAIRRIREGGYHSFSVREIADELGIKSASIYYHFPSKEALGIAVAKDYTRLFLDSLGSPSDHANPIEHFLKAFQKALETQKAACLCGILAAESRRLPEPVRDALAGFTEGNINWLEGALKQQRPDWPDDKIVETAPVIFAAMEGAITFAAMGHQPIHLKKISDWILDVVST